jgi:uncharacterized protein (TIGR04255 family)
MSIKDLLLPYKIGQEKASNHSISEAVFVVYLANEIINPERYKKLLKDSNGFFKDLFDEYKDVYSHGIPINVENGEPNIDGEIENVVTGFSFKKFLAGKPEWIINANNRPNPHIAIHCLNYKRWIPFVEFIDGIINALSPFDSGIFIKAIGLNYVDQFNWIGGSNIDFRLIFNEESAYVPSIVYSRGDDWGFTINVNTEINELDKMVHICKLYSKRISKQNLNIGIIHNNVYEYNKPIRITELIENKSLLDYEPLNGLHIANKDFLKELLTKEVLDIINLK